MTRHFVMATAGHVDHGKSSLVRALTGVDPDRLPEEKARGITIDLGFAQLSLTDGPDVLNVGIVDVPGHEDFVKNMVAGVGMVDLALLVVAADDGWMPQTEEHLQILSYLGCRHLLVAVTKIDLREDVQPVIQEIRDQLKHSRFAGAEIVSCSTASDASIVKLKSSLCGLLRSMPPTVDYGKPRLAIDRVFSLRGLGTVVTGTLQGGTFETGQAVVVQPRGLAARIRSIQSHNRSVAKASPGTRVALNLPELSSDPASDNAARRGEVVMLPGSGIPATTLDVELERSDRATTEAMPTVKQAGRVRLHVGSASVPARVSLASGTELKRGERGIAQLRLESPVTVFRGDRFILRDESGRFTLAGGWVLDAGGHRKKFRDPERREYLAREASAGDDVTKAIEARVSLELIVPKETLLVFSRFSQEQVLAGLEALKNRNAVRSSAKLVIAQSEFERLCRVASEIIAAEHQTHPEKEGTEIAKLTAALGWPESQPELTEVVCGHLTARDYVRKGGVLQKRGHEAALPPALDLATRKIREALLRKPLDPPSRKELAADKTQQDALRFMIKKGEVVELNSEIVLLSEAVRNAQDRVRERLRKHGGATVSELRDVLGSTRRTIIPLLELFDKRGLTRRIGDKRSWSGPP